MSGKGCAVREGSRTLVMVDQPLCLNHDSERTKHNIPLTFLAFLIWRGICLDSLHLFPYCSLDSTSAPRKNRESLLVKGVYFFLPGGCRFNWLVLVSSLCRRASEQDKDGKSPESGTRFRVKKKKYHLASRAWDRSHFQWFCWRK